jgi:hypothetical protein
MPKLSPEQQAAQEQQAKNIAGHLPTASISAIAAIIARDWKNPYFGAQPYLSAMYSMDKITDPYLADPGTHIVNYFISNAQTWRGPVAKLVKAELNKRVKEATRR